MAFGKLHGMLASAPLNLPGKNAANLGMAAGSLAAGAALLTTGDPATGLVQPFTNLPFCNELLRCHQLPHAAGHSLFD